MLYHLQILDLGTILNLARNLFNNLQFVGQYGLLAVFFAHMSPSVLFIMEGVDTAAVILGFNPFAIVLFAVLGGTIGDFTWYYAGFYSYRKLKKIENGKAVRVAKQHRRLAFLYSAFPGGTTHANPPSAGHLASPRTKVLNEFQPPQLPLSSAERPIRVSHSRMEDLKLRCWLL